MKKKTIISLLFAGVLTVGAFTGLTGFADKDNAQDNTGEYMLLSAEEDEADVDEADDVQADEAQPDGTITGVADVAEEVMPAVVSITNKTVQEVRSMFGDMFDMYGFYYGYDNGYNDTYEIEQESVGSGIIIGQSDEELLICTNYHVVADATELTVGFVDNEIYKAVVKGSDPSNDLAVVAVNISDISEDTLDQIKVAQIGNSDNLVVGEQVVAIGNALGYGQSVTTGIVSALNRTLQLDGYDNTQLIQTDAAINGGNSGGALLDMDGHVIGINSAKVSASGVEGMGYAIPISYAQPILEELMNKKTRTETVAEEDSAYMGITGESVSSEMTEFYGIPKGVFITEVSEGSPAEEAGLQRGDIITRFDGSGVTTMSELQEMLAYYAAGEEVKMVVSTADSGEYVERDVTITLGARSDYELTSE